MNGLSLCAGIGGIDLGLHLAAPNYRTICYVEIEAYPQDVLLARMADGVLDRAPIWGDITQFDAKQWRGLVDVVHGGYPCQPFSVAGQRKGADDLRHLWPDIARVVNECTPEWCFFENVAGHLTLGFEQVARDLEALGYQVAAGLFTAAEVGAPHRRQRLYILARLQRVSLSNRSKRGAPTALSTNSQSVGPPNHPRLEGRREPEREGPDERLAWPPGPEERDRWADIAVSHPHLIPATGFTEPRSERSEATPEPAIRRMADGLPHRVDRLKALGNAVVPNVVALAWRTLYGELNG